MVVGVRKRLKRFEYDGIMAVSTDCRKRNHWETAWVDIVVRTSGRWKVSVMDTNTFVCLLRLHEVTSSLS